VFPAKWFKKIGLKKEPAIWQCIGLFRLYLMASTEIQEMFSKTLSREKIGKNRKK
jgi:hypothetical protein